MGMWLGALPPSLHLLALAPELGREVLHRLLAYFAKTAQQRTWKTTLVLRRTTQAFGGLLNSDFDAVVGLAKVEVACNIWQRPRLNTSAEEFSKVCAWFRIQASHDGSGPVPHQSPPRSLRATPPKQTASASRDRAWHGTYDDSFSRFLVPAFMCGEWSPATRVKPSEPDSQRRSSPSSTNRPVGLCSATISGTKHPSRRI